MNSKLQVIANPLALAGGFALSFIGLGILWVGIGWSYQCLMLLPFALLAYSVRRMRGQGLMVLAGAFPIAALLVQFRDQNDSHLTSYLVVLSWCAGAWLGNFSARRAGQAKDH